MQVRPEHYLDSHQYWADAQAVGVLRKCQDLPTTGDRKAVALENFWLSEKACFRTNERLRPFLYPLNADHEEGIWRFISKIRKNVAYLLGPCPYNVRGRFGPGATFGDKGSLTTVPDKMTSKPTLTPDATSHMLLQWTETAWAKACVCRERDPEYVRGNRFTTVAKDCVKDRGIAVEPSINLFYQLAYGQVMKDRLFRAGLDLRNAQTIHKQVACEASIRGHFATIDLSNASDTVCKSLVELLLPERWFEALSALRSPATLVEERWVLLEKFSSMGNGYTFELETTLFAAIAMAVMQELHVNPVPGSNVYVFGDDIIVPTACAEGVLTVLRFLGFTPNAKKTFVSGPFRESCGGDFFNGVDVRPFFLEEFPYEPQQFIAMANGFRRMVDSVSRDCRRSSTLIRAWFRILDALPSDVRRLRGPQDLGDLVIHDGEERWQVRWRHSIRYIACYRPARFRRVGWEHWHESVVLASALYGVDSGLPTSHKKLVLAESRADFVGPTRPRKQNSNDVSEKHDTYGITPRDAVLGYKVGWVPYS
jgi:hypothetical protein